MNSPIREEFEKEYRLGPRDFSGKSVGEVTAALSDLSNALFACLKSEAAFVMRHAVRRTEGADLVSSERVFRVAFYSTELDTLATELTADRRTLVELQVEYDLLNKRCDVLWTMAGGRVAFVRGT